MATRGDLQDRIADDLVDAPVTATQIRAAVDDAIAFYESDRFKFNETKDRTHTFSSSNDTVPLTNLPVYFLKIDRLSMRYSGAQNLTDLYARDFDWLMRGQDVKAVTRPLEYCIYGDAINFDSVPNQAYVGILSGVYRVSSTASLSPTANASAWFNDGKALLRYRAEVDLLANVVRDNDEAAKKQVLLDREFKRLKQQINTRNSGRVRPTEF